MQDFRSEVKEFFAGDEQLAEELEFALKNAEKNREMEEENCPPAGEARTPTAEVSAAVVLSIELNFNNFVGLPVFSRQTLKQN